MPSDPMADYINSIIGVPQSYTGSLENLGFTGTPFASQEQSWQDISGFQNTLKGILDNEMKNFGGGNNTNVLPFNLMNMFHAAAPIYGDTMYGPGGHYLENGWQYGNPQNNSLAGQGNQGQWASPAYNIWYNRKIAPPAATIPVANGAANNNGGGGGGGGPSNHNLVGQYTVSNPSGGGSVTVNASDPTSAAINAGWSDPSQAHVQQGSYKF